MATKFVNQVNFPIPVDAEHKTKVTPFPALDNNAYRISDLVTENETASILASLENSNWLPVSITGMSGNYVEGDPIGSYRASNYTPEYAAVLWERIKDQIPAQRVFTDTDNTDWDGHEFWEPFAVSPLLRFIKYTDQGWLVVHYDAPYVESDDVRTLQSFVIYLQHDETLEGGATRYLYDPQMGMLISDRNLTDQTRAANPEEVRLQVQSTKGGGAVIFDHRLLHDAEKVEGEGSKIIIRTDILYRKVK